LLSTTPLAFDLVCKHTTLSTLGDVVQVIGKLTPDQRETHSWKVAIHMLNSAIKEPRYLRAATIRAGCLLGHPRLIELLHRLHRFGKLCFSRRIPRHPCR
jgi:hypothetical protein